MTYRGMARIAVSVDSALQFDAESLVKGIEEEFMCLKSQCPSSEFTIQSYK